MRISPTALTIGALTLAATFISPASASTVTSSAAAPTYECVQRVTRHLYAAPCRVGDKKQYLPTSTTSVGTSGASGPQGPQGPQGPSGPAGAKGLDGKPGKNGWPGKDGKPGTNGKDGKDGLPGLPGKDGKDGEDGAPGKPGADGAPGKDGKGLDGAFVLNLSGIRQLCVWGAPYKGYPQLDCTVKFGPAPTQSPSPSATPPAATPAPAIN